MPKLKDYVRDEVDLTKLVQARVGALAAEMETALSPFEADYINARSWRIKLPALVFGLAIVWVVFKEETTASISAPVFVLLSWLIMGVLGYALVKGIKMAQIAQVKITEFNRRLDELVYPVVFQTLGVTGALMAWPKKALIHSKLPPQAAKAIHYLQVNGILPKDTVDTTAVLPIIQQSELLTTAFNIINTDNLYTVNLNGQVLQAMELELKQQTGSGKNRREVTVFYGHLMSLELRRTLKGKTFVSTEGDESGFGHHNFWSGLRESNLRETSLEWNAFEDLLHVMTTDEVEARYVLTTDFMSDLYDWWQTKKGNIRLSFIGNKMYILLPDRRVRLGDTIKKITPAELEGYLMSIATPLLHALHLSEDVNL